MSTDEVQNPTLENRTPSVNPGNYSPVTVHMEDILGVVFPGILCSVLLIGWMRAEGRWRALMAQLEQNDGNHSSSTR